MKRAALRARAIVPALVLVATLGASAFTFSPPVNAGAPLGPAHPDASLTLAQRHTEAMRCLRQGEFAAAYGRFAALADEGHAPAAYLALALLRNGVAQFGSQWSATPGQLQRWGALLQRDLNAEAPNLDISQFERDE